MICYMNPDQKLENLKATGDQLVLAPWEPRTVFVDVMTDDYLVLS